jgi:RNA polymerase sigma-70 factor (ECF subfamily)
VNGNPRDRDGPGAHNEAARLTALIHRVGGRIRASVRRRAPHLSRADVEDVTAEVFVVAWERRADWPEGDDRLEAWVLTIARHKTRHAVAAAFRRARMVDFEAAVDLPVADEDLLAAMESSQWTRELLAKLTRKEREVLYLRIFVGLSIKETAEALGCSESVVTTRYARAIAHAKRILLEDAEGGDREWRTT